MLLGATLGKPCWAGAAPAWPDNAVPPVSWTELLLRAQGQQVGLLSLPGDHSGRFLEWAGEQLRARNGITLLPLHRPAGDDIGASLASAGGAADLLALRGRDFAAMKEAGLLRPFSPSVPHSGLLAPRGRAAGIPLEGLAVPWRKDRVVFLHHHGRLPEPPRSMFAMADWARAHPGRLTHPAPRHPAGEAFLLQGLYETVANPARLSRPAPEDAFTLITAPFWAWYQSLRPHLWEAGRAFPQDQSALYALLREDALDLGIAPSMSGASAALASGRLPQAVRPYLLPPGTLEADTFLGLPATSTRPEAAMVMVDFLLSPEAQALGEGPLWLGAATVLDLARLPLEERARFRNPRPFVAPPRRLPGPALPEPHPSWAARLLAEWERRIGGDRR